jgi:hypothetical protein
MKPSLLSLVVLAFVATPIAEAAKPQIQWDSAYDFSRIRTFQWSPGAESTLEQRNPFMHSRVVSAIDYELCATGLTEVETSPDVYVTYHASVEDKVRLESDSYGYGFGSYGRGGWGAYGYSGVVPVMTTTREVEYEEGTLVVDIWDAASRQLVWRGTLSRVFADNAQKAEKQVIDAIEDMAKQSARLRARAAD